ncbi:MAG: ribonuclease HII [Puniceicoccaceae bacterium]|nr:MAG: ribonuclease HII [Puniceicoccaceae bacterium]
MAEVESAPKQRRRLRGFDLDRLRGGPGIIGVDEAGRGAFAGPVVACALLAGEAFLRGSWCRRHASGIDDSKALSPARRARLLGLLRPLAERGEVVYATGVGEIEEIETHNIVGATTLAMRRALLRVARLAGLDPRPPDPLFASARPTAPANAPRFLEAYTILVDGRPLRGLGFKHQGVVDGDALSLTIALASIVAKETRDRLMVQLDGQAPDYGFANHKGYGTPSHRESIVRHGPSPWHRPSFLHKLLRTIEDPGQLTLFGPSDPAGS